ncbi:heme-binding protein [Haloferula sp.]|uniref:heme-binding protein n=1 Tax=Haloferula sp. TaxID=2497595 RepID=UPI003C718332
MKKKFFPLFALIAACNLHAEEKAIDAPKYVNEAPLPEKWPEPGPFNKVEKKSYPAYRAAFTNGKGETSSFWRLFSHIKKNDIPMTAPVEMSMSEQDGKLSQAGMAFLYQNGTVGTKGPDGAKVEVRDIKAVQAYSYAWQGNDSKENIAKARTALEETIEAEKVETLGFRLLGYNGPGTPRNKRTWELQAVLK